LPSANETTACAYLLQNTATYLTVVSSAGFLSSRRITEPCLYHGRRHRRIYTKRYAVTTPVVVPDAPLAEAVNRCLNEPHFGTFATTPRRLVAGRSETSDERQAFLDVIERLNHSRKSASYAVENVLSCWEHEGKFSSLSGLKTPESVELVCSVRDLNPGHCLERAI
jgi:hypothetical protein